MVEPREYKSPIKTEIAGSYITLHRLCENHIDGLWECFSATDDSSWDYMGYGAFETKDEFSEWINKSCLSDDPYFYCVRDNTTNNITGMLSLMRINITHGNIEVGHIHFGDKLKGTTGATESVFLLLQYGFELGHRRFEWKCDNDNNKSKNSAVRFGFRFEGVFRQHMIVKGKNRDTAWFAIMDSEWENIKTEYQRWLNPNNFDENGQQKTKLEINNA